MDLCSLAGRVGVGLEPARLFLVSSQCRYYHYLCDGEDDRGWGCGYRTLQSLCSWADGRGEGAKEVGVPSLRRVQEVLVEVGDKAHSFLGSHEWIGSYEACIVLDHLYGVPCRIIHVASGGDVLQYMSTLVEHFRTVGSPIMIGGDIDAASKTLIGVYTDLSRPENTRLLIADPHYCGPADETSMLGEGYVRWHGLELFQHTSFYNFCLPQSPSSLP